MSKRKFVGLTIVALWIGTLAWHAGRLYLNPASEELAAAARTLPPGVAYYAVYQGDRHIGWAQSQVDTLPGASGFVVSDRLQVELASLGVDGRAEVTTRARLGPALGLEEFSLEARGLLGGMSAAGRVVGDSVLRFEVRRQGRSSSHSVPLEGSVILGTSLPLRIAAEGGGSVGTRYDVGTFDPVRMEVTRGTVEILERDVRTFPDSVDRDSVSQSWEVVGRDTVRAWKIRREMAGTEVTAWVDEDGRYLELTTPVGLRLERTAFELAYYGSGLPAEDAGPGAGSGPAPSGAGAEGAAGGDAAAGRPGGDGSGRVPDAAPRTGGGRP